MPIEVVDDQAMTDALKSAFEDDLPDAVFVNVHYIGSPHGTSMDFEGLDIALIKVKEGRPIILYGVETQSWMMRDSRFADILTKSNVAYIQAPFRHENVRMIYRQLKSQKI